jgi:gluconokinase
MPGLSVVVTGVAGAGKTTVGWLLAARMSVPYAEADTFHPPGNVTKMARGIPLDDEDRQPWLAAIADRLASAGPDGLVVSCSALRRRYRDRLRAAEPAAWFVQLTLDRTLATARVTARHGHFFSAELVESQFRALEPLEQDERGITIDTDQAPDRIVEAVLDRLPR